MSIKPRKVAVVGAGMVGTSCAFAIVNQGLCSELLMVDINVERAKGEAWDIAQGVLYMPTRTKVRQATLKECADADVVVFAAGGPPKVGQTRLDTLSIGLSISKSVVKELKEVGFSGIYVVATNPVDIITYAIQKESGLDHNKVIGTGTSIDTARMLYFFSQELPDIDNRSLGGFALGEHGDSQVNAWSTVTVGGKKLSDLITENPEKYGKIDYKALHAKIIRAGFEILERKGTTCYGISSAVATIIKSIFSDEKRVIAVSAYLKGEYGSKDIYAGVPAIIGSNGVEGIMELKLTSEEKSELDNSFKVIADYIKKCD